MHFLSLSHSSSNTPIPPRAEHTPNFSPTTISTIFTLTHYSSDISSCSQILQNFFLIHLHPLPYYILPIHTITLHPTTTYRECDKRTRLSAQFLILIIKVCKHPNPNPLRNSSTGIPCNQPNNYPHHGLFCRLPILLVTVVPHHCPLRPHRTFTTPSLSSIIRNFTNFLASTFVRYVFLMYPPPSPPGDLLDSFAFSFVLPDISDVQNPLSISHSHSH